MEQLTKEALFTADNDKVSNGYILYSSPEQYPAYRQTISDFPSSLLAIWVYSVVFSAHVEQDGIEGFHFIYNSHIVFINWRDIDMFMQKLRESRPAKYSYTAKWIEFTRKKCNENTTLAIFIALTFNPICKLSDHIHGQIVSMYEESGLFPLSAGAQKSEVYSIFSRMLSDIISESEYKDIWEEIVKDSYMEE